jgi:hypothetical protein
VAGAYVASANSVKNNDEFYRATQAARVAVLRVTSEVRRAQIVDVDSPADANGNTTQIKVFTYNGQDFTYKYDSQKKQLLLVTNSNLTDADYVLVRNVASASFNILKGVDSSGAQCVSHVGLTLTVAVGKNQVTLSGAAAPRCNLPK